MYEKKRIGNVLQLYDYKNKHIANTLTCTSLQRTKYKFNSALNQDQICTILTIALGMSRDTHVHMGVR